MIKFNITVLTLLMVSTAIFAQLPISEVVLLDISAQNNWVASHPRLLTAFNANSYNNQPYFLSDHSCWITSQPLDNPTQTDIIEIDWNSKRYSRITKTSDSEYSPKKHPNGDYFTCVKTDAQTPDNQRLWAYPLDGSHAGYDILPTHDNIGYYQYNKDGSLVIWVLGLPHELYFINPESKLLIQIANNPGRCFKFYNDELIYVQKSEVSNYYLKAYNPNTDQSRIIISMPDKVEDFDITPTGQVLTAAKGYLYTLKMDIEKQWKQTTNLEGLGINAPGRLVFHPSGKLLIINTKP